LKIAVRPARPSDKEPLMEFIRRVWGGHDYIPSVWDSWLRDRNSEMFVATADGLQVGMNRIRYMPDGSGWLEGARVHPAYRGRGVASSLAEAAIAAASGKGVTVFRLTSGSHNKTAHRHIARIGFTEISRVSTYTPSKGMRLGPVGGVERLTGGDFETVSSSVRNSREYRLGAGVLWDVFAVRSLDDGEILRALNAGEAYGCGGAVAMAKVGREGTEVWRQVCFVCGGGDDAVRLVRHAFGMRGEPRADRRFAYVPQGSGVISSLRSAGFERDFSLVLFERRLAKG
jgi:GNAT superfamily N-acetyltransferase